MYHISNDPRCVKSCLLIRQTLLDILKENGNNLEGVSISDVTDRSTVSRSTFYRHFDTLNDVLIWTSNQEVESAVDSTPLFNNNYWLFCENFFAYWVAHSDFLETLVGVGHAEYFLISLEKFLGKISKKLFEGSSLSASQQGYMVTVWSAIVWSILKRWVLEGKRETSGSLADIAYHSLPRPH